MTYDFAIVGAGCAGWQLLYQLSKLPNWEKQTVLLLDERLEPEVYPTWCFWTKENHPLEFLSSKSWTEVAVYTPQKKISTRILPYNYIYINGKTFYDYFINDFLPNNPNIHFQKFKVEKIEKEKDGRFILHSLNNSYLSRKVYSSTSFEVNKDTYLKLSQNFIGWIIEFENPVLEENKAIFMDFRNSTGTIFEFMYILPYDTKSGLIEWTSFIHKTQLEPDYDNNIYNYLNQYFPDQPYKILRKEKASIPMSTYPYPKQSKLGVIYIGSAAGLIKPSTGYTFNRITLDSVALLKREEGIFNTRPYTRKRFLYYDTLLLRILKNKPGKGLKIFYLLFENTKFLDVLKFLDEETSFREDIRIFSKLPKWELIKAIFKH